MIDNPTIIFTGSGGTSIAPYDSGKAYEAGELFIYNNRYGITTTAHTAEAFNAAHNALTAMQSDIVSIETAITTIQSALTTINATLTEDRSRIVTAEGNIAEINSDIVDLTDLVDELSDTVEEVSETTTQHEQDIAAIQAIVPSTATIANPLATLDDIPSDVASKYEITISGDNGTFTDAQFAALMNNSKNTVIVNAGERYYLSDEVSGSYRTYINVNMPSETVLSRKEISVNISPQAVNYKHWSKEVGIITDNVLVIEYDYTVIPDSENTSVPDLSVEQITEICEAIEADKYVYLEDTFGSNQVLVSQRAPTDDSTAIYFSYFGRMLLTYSIVNNEVVITYKEIFDKSYLDSTYAPLSYVASLHGELGTGNKINLVDTPPTASANNILQLADSTNTSYNWNSPSVIFVRQLKVATMLTNTNSMTLQLKYKTSRDTTLSWGARVEYSTDNVDWTAISSNQSYNAVDITADNGTTTDITVVMNTISGTLSLQQNNYLRVLLFKKQDTTTALTTNMYFGVNVDNAYVGMTAQFNFANVSINTAQLLDGSVTKPKLSAELQAEINGKQNTLNSTQMQAVNSGVTSSGWQQALSDLQVAAADIDSLESDVYAAQVMLSSHDTTIDSLSTAVSSHTSQISDLQSRVSFVENDIDTIEQAINDVVPEKASSTNKLATMSDTINNTVGWYNNLPTATVNAPDFAGVVDDGMYYKEVVLYSNFADNSWGAIAYAFQHNVAPSTWTVGSTKHVTLTDGNVYTVRLIDINEEPRADLGRFAYSNKYGHAKAVFEFVECVKLEDSGLFNMNAANVNEGGFSDSDMLLTHLEAIAEILPDELLNNISDVDVLSGIGDGTTSGTKVAHCKLFLPCERELFSATTFSIGPAEDTYGQFTYYKNKTATAFIKQLDGTAAKYWMRSTKTNSSKEFCTVNTAGESDHDEADYEYAVAPIFAI